MTSTATTRNASIKKILRAAFPGRKITVRGSRGTAYGYASVKIDWTPLDQDEAREMKSLCFQLLAKAQIDLGSRYTDDTCQYTCSEVSIDFNNARYYRAMKHDDGTMSVIRDPWASEWEAA